ncbi:unnamed protein product, partial [Rotaria socialis]
RIFTLLTIQICKQIQSQCSGRIWTIQDITIGSFTISWRYNNTSNTVQFVIQGQASTTINIASTYIAMGWSDTVPTGNTMDVAMFFPGTQIVQDSQQDYCAIQTNITDQPVYLAFERLSTTGDADATSSLSYVHLIFSMVSYTQVNHSNTFELEEHFFRKPFKIRINLMH